MKFFVIYFLSIHCFLQFILHFIVLCNDLPICDENIIKDDKENLYNNLDVIQYNLKYNFTNDLTEYNASVRIKFKFLNDDNFKLILNSKENVLTEFNLREINYGFFNSNVNIENICIDKNKSDEIIINVDQSFKKDIVYFLFIQFNGKSSTGMNGIYISNYLNDKNTETIVSTHFEPEYARQAFPCIDYPNKKATFLLTLIHSTLNKSYSNMPVNNIVFFLFLYNLIKDY